MQIRIELYTKERIDDVLVFEHELRKQKIFGVGKLMRLMKNQLEKVFLTHYIRRVLVF